MARKDKSNENVDKPVKEQGSIGKAFGWCFVPFGNIFSWFGLSTIKGAAAGIMRSAKFFCTPTEPGKSETFEQACTRLNLTERDIKAREQRFFRIAIAYGFIALLILFYALYLAFHAEIGGFFLALTVCGLVLASAFRYHFWFFQVKKRKLGCTVQEWYASKLQGED